MSVSDAAVVLLVRFRSHLSKDEVLAVANERAPDFRAIPGLTQKFYLEAMEGGEYAGLYLWDSPESLGAFAQSELKAAIADVYKMDGEPRVEAYRVDMALRD